MKIRIYLLLFTCLSLQLEGQDYFNRIIPFEFGNPLPSGLYVYGENLLIPTIHTDTFSTLIEVGNDEIRYIHYNGFDFSRVPLSVINDRIFAFAKDRSKTKGLKLAELNIDYDFTWLKDIETNGDFDFPTACITDCHFIYISYLVEWEEPYHREFGIVKHDSEGNEIWKKNYSQENKLTYPTTMIPTMDGNIIVSAGVVYNDVVGRYSQMTKFNPNGEEIWQFAGEEAFENGGISPWCTELSDSSLLMTYVVDRWGDEEFIANGWNRDPVRMQWFDAHGNPTAQTFWIVPANEDFQINGLQKGRGNYFFAFGEYKTFDDNQYYGFINKMSNAGDTIWTAWYQNPSFSEPITSHSVLHIVEHDNGDISALGVISSPSNAAELWHFKVNEFGCFYGEACNEFLTDLNPVEYPDREILVYPNPTRNRIRVEANFALKHAYVYNSRGKLLITSKEQEIDLQSLPKGIYFLEIQLQNGQFSIKKIAKH